jgi:hypothetical protein
MPLYTFKDKQIAEVTSTSFAAERIREREDIQAALRDKIEIISPDTLIISEEFSEWSEGGRRIDLLGIDKQANIVVIELKRDETGAHMELQSLRYAAMVSTLTFKKAVEIYQKYLGKRDIIKDAEIDLIDFLGWSDPLEDLFPTDVRIVLASANFSRELTTAVMWLNERDLDIRCVRLKPYKLGDEILLDIEQIIPLPEAEDYQIQVREQTEERKAAAKAAKDMTKYLFNGIAYRKNRLVFAVINQYLAEYQDTTLQKLKEVFPDSLQGTLGVTATIEKAQEIFSKTSHKRHFLAENDILRTADGSEIAVCTEWGKGKAGSPGNIDNFIGCAKELGYQIEAE